MVKACAAVGIERDNKVTPHDLRRTFSTTLTGLGFTRDQLNRQTGHVEGGIASVYDRHSYGDENRRIAEAVCGRILSLVEGAQDEGKVIPLHA
jgi:integrase